MTSSADQPDNHTAKPSGQPSAHPTEKPPRGQTALQRAEARYATAKARLSAARNRQITEDRKRDTRRKIILGGALIDLAGRDARALELLDRLLRNLPREQDRKVFEDWTVPAEGPITSGDAP